MLGDFIAKNQVIQKANKPKIDKIFESIDKEKERNKKVYSKEYAMEINIGLENVKEIIKREFE